jgi:hypothetical protein
LASSDETFGITPLPSPLINFFSMEQHTPNLTMESQPDPKKFKEDLP